MNAVGIIPARGGSTRVPRKNVAVICGKPLVAWAIDAALGSTFVYLRGDEPAERW